MITKHSFESLEHTYLYIPEKCPSGKNTILGEKRPVDVSLRPSLFVGSEVPEFEIIGSFPPILMMIS